jgi:arylsulfatase A-like enzyme
MMQTFLVVSGSLTLLTAAAHVFWLAAVAGMGRLRETLLLGFVRRLLHGVEIDWQHLVHGLFSEPFDLLNPRTLFLFLFLAVIANLVLAWAITLLVTPVLLGLRKLFPPESETRKACWLWQTGYPVAVAVIFAIPGLFLLVDEVTKPLIRGVSMELTLASTVPVAVTLLWLLKEPRRGARFCSRLGVVGLTVLTLAAAAAVAAFFLRPSPPVLASSSGQTRPNILLISIDSLRRDHLSCYGYLRQTTPAIDALAREGVRFETVASPTTWTLPAHLTLLTSLPPEVHGVINDSLRLGPDAVSVAQVLWRQGYATAGFVSGPYLQADYGFFRGFDHYDDYTVAQPTHEESHRGITSPGLFHLVSRWLQAWDDRGQPRPFFIFLHMWDVHYDYTPPPPYDALYDPDYAGTVTADNYEEGNEVHAGMEARDLQHVVALYDGEIRFTDEYVGRILEQLNWLGILDRTIVVVTSDHGDEFFEHGNKGHRKALYDETLLVPLVIRYPPSIPAGSVVRHQVRLMDVAPTILHLAGVAPLPDFGSLGRQLPQAERDLTPLIQDQTGENGMPVAAYGDLHGEQFSIRTESAKFIHRAGKRETYELYNLVKDPGEQENLVDSDPALASALSRQLDDRRVFWAARSGHALQLELSEEQKERLRSLGYLK